MTINKSIGELTTLDGSLDKTLKASEQLKDLPQILQKYMLLGNYQIGNAKKFDSHSIFNDIGSIDGFIAQFVNLDEAQQKAFLSLSSFDEGLEDYIENTKNAVQIGEKFNSQLFEQIASQKDGITTGVLNEFMKAGGLKDAKGVLALPNTQDAIALMEDYANHCSDASKTQQLFNAGILEQENGVYKLSQAFLKEISVKQASTVATVALTAAQKAWNVVAQYGKQLLLSLGVAAVAFIATKIVDYLMNLKTHSEELVATMNDSHDAAEQATKDVEEIQSKIDELNKSLKDAGVKKIEDIVDPAERERLQAINDMLQAQLELKKQLEKDANDKANADTSAVVNDKTEDSIVKSRTVNVSYAEGGANAGTHQVAEKVSKTESLHEYAAALEDTTQKRRDLQVELDQIEASSGKDSEEYANKKKELDALNETFESQKTQVEELSTAVSEQMGNYKTDADSFAQYKDEYVAGTNAMTAATKALANAQDNTGIDTTNLDIFSEKIKQIWNILTELRDLYFPFEMYFDDDTFVCKEIPSGYDDPVVLDEDTFKSMVISEDASVDYGQIHNCVEVWGASNSSDYFCKDKLEKNDPDGTGEVVYCKKGTKEWNDVVTLLKDNKLNMSYNMNPNDTGASILLLKLKQASIQDGTRFSFICPEDIAINARICVENLVTTIKTNPTGAGQYRETTRAVYGPMMLFKAVTNEKGEDEPEDTSLLRKGRYYVIKYGEHWLNQATDGAFTYKFNALTGKYEKEQRDPQVRYYPKQIYNPSTKNYDTVYVKYNPATNTEIQISDPALLIESRVYFIGQSQSHAMTKFVDAMPTAKQIEADKIAEACDNLEYVVVNDPNRIDDLYNSRLTIDKIGRRNLVCSGSEFDGYTSDESAMTVCKYTLWKNCRLTDSITLSMHMIPWLDVNEKVKYAAKYLKSDIAVEWIIKKIDKNIGEGTMNVTLSRYYPYYPYITYENVLKEKYIDNKKDT